MLINVGKGEGKVGSLESRIERLEFYHKLLLDLLDVEKAQYYKLIVDADLSREDVKALHKLCEELSILYQEQKAEGLIVFSPLLTQFAGLLHPHLNVEKTIEVLLNQGMYIPLMTEFIKVLRNKK